MVKPVGQSKVRQLLTWVRKLKCLYILVKPVGQSKVRQLLTWVRKLKCLYILVKPVGQSKVRQLLTGKEIEMLIHFSKTSWSV